MKRLLAAALACACSSKPAPAPLAAPGHVTGLRVPQGGILSWDAVDGATGYVVSGTWTTGVTPQGHNHYSVAADKTSFGLGWGDGVTSVNLSVRAEKDQTDGQESVALLFPDADTEVTATATETTVDLHWTRPDPGFGRATVYRAASDQGPYATIALSRPEDTFEDSGLQPGTRYYYEVVMPTSDASMGVAGAMTIQTAATAPSGGPAVAPAAPSIVAYSAEAGVEIDLSPVPGALTYQVGASPTSGGPYWWQDLGSSTSTVIGCSSGEICFVVAKAISASGVASLPSVEVHGEAGPFGPSATTQSAAGHVHLTWTRPPNSGSFSVYRAAADNVWELAGTTTEGSFDDTAGIPFTLYQYAVTATSIDGHYTSTRTLAMFRAFATTVPDQLNIAGTPVPSPNGLGLQTITVGQSGQFMGIELQGSGLEPRIALRAGPFLLGEGSLLLAPYGVAASDLTADVIRDAYYDFSAAGIYVSAGEHLAIQFSPGVVTMTGDVYSGGSFAPFGTPDPAIDLRFKTFVMPAETAPPKLAATGGDRAIALSWSMVPDATAYEIVEQVDAQAQSTVASTTETFAFAAGLQPGSAHTYVLITHLASGAVLTSAPVTASALSDVVDQVNAGDSYDLGDAAYAGQYQTSIGQSFTCGTSGVLTGVELAPYQGSLSDNPVIELLDDTGTILGTGSPATPPAATASGPFPLTTALRTGTFIDFSSLGVAVTPGSVLSIRISGTSTLFRDTPELYSGGSEMADSAATARDLVFRSWVLP